jgi:hypothetical protein
VRTTRPDDESATRAYLLEEAREFRRLMCSTLLEESAEMAQFASDQLSPRVDALANGRAVRLHRFELPPGHVLSAPHAGRPNDWLELGEDNVIRRPAGP